MASFDFDTLTLGEVATIEDLSGFGIASLNEGTPQGKFLAALVMVFKRRNGEPTFTFNQALAVPMLEAQTLLGLDDTEPEAAIAAEVVAEGKGESSPTPERANKRSSSSPSE